MQHKLIMIPLQISTLNILYFFSMIPPLWQSATQILLLPTPKTINKKKGLWILNKASCKSYSSKKGKHFQYIMIKVIYKQLCHCRISKRNMVSVWVHLPRRNLKKVDKNCFNSCVYELLSRTERYNTFRVLVSFRVYRYISGFVNVLRYA